MRRGLRIQMRTQPPTGTLSLLLEREGKFVERTDTPRVSRVLPGVSWLSWLALWGRSVGRSARDFQSLRHYIPYIYTYIHTYIYNCILHNIDGGGACGHRRRRKATTHTIIDAAAQSGRALDSAASIHRPRDSGRFRGVQPPRRWWSSFSVPVVRAAAAAAAACTVPGVRIIRSDFTCTLSILSYK